MSALTTQPDFVRLAQTTSGMVSKDRYHTLIVFSTLGLAIVGYAFFNPEHLEGLLIGGIFFLIVGVARFLRERYGRPRVTIAIIKKKKAVPYPRMPGTFDYFVDAATIESFAFSSDGRHESVPVEKERRWKVSGNVFAKLEEGKQTMILFSSTKTLLGIVHENYAFTAN